MNYRRLGKTGLQVSTICLGTMQFGWSADEDTAFAIMNRAIELGCNFFDTADIYSYWVEGNVGGESEKIIGRWLKQDNIKREHLILATKVRGPMGQEKTAQGLSRHHIFNAVDNSLRRLQTDYIDLYQVHFPDQETPLEETLSALNDLVRIGKVRYIGCSNYPAWLLMKSLWLSDSHDWARFDSIQPHYNLVHRAEFERELQAVCLDQGIGVIPYSPLAGGFLTGKYRRDLDMPASDRANGIQNKYMNEQGFSAVDALAKTAQEHDATIAQVAIAWTLANPVVSSAIIGANTLKQLEDTLLGASITLSAEEKEALDQITAWT